MAVNGVPRAQRKPEPVLSDMIEQSARVYLVEAAYAGGPACIQPKWVTTEDFIAIGRDLAKDLGCRFDSYIDKPTGVAAVRFNMGYPAEIRIASPEAKEWLEANPGFLEGNAIFHNLYYGLSVVD